MHLAAERAAVGFRLLFRIAAVVLQTRRCSACLSQGSNGVRETKRQKQLTLEVIMLEVKMVAGVQNRERERDRR